MPLEDELAAILRRADNELDTLRADLERVTSELDDANSDHNAAQIALIKARAERDAAVKTYADHMATHQPDVEPDPEPPTTALPMIFGAATTNDQTKFDALNAAWGPIRAACEYDSGRSFEPVTNYAWYAFVKRNFKYLRFSADAQTNEADYKRIPTGDFDNQIRAMLNSIPTALPGVRGVICLGNEPNAGKKDITAATYRAAIEHCIDTFGHEPAPGFMWGIAYTNFDAWGQGRSEGENWLPRRPDGPFMVETHFYGKDTYVPPADALGRSFLPAVRKRPNWSWSVGEMSAQEDATQTKKGAWFRAVADYAAPNGAAMLLPFDTGVGGSAPIATSETTRKAVQGIATKYAGNDWT